MTSSPRLTFHVRLEDLVALTFFLLNLLLRIIFRGLEGAKLQPCRRPHHHPGGNAAACQGIGALLYGGKARLCRRE